MIKIFDVVNWVSKFVLSRSKYWHFIYFLKFIIDIFGFDQWIFNCLVNQFLLLFGNVSRHITVITNTLLSFWRRIDVCMIDMLLIPLGRRATSLPQSRRIPLILFGILLFSILTRILNYWIDSVRLTTLWCDNSWAILATSWDFAISLLIIPLGLWSAHLLDLC